MSSHSMNRRTFLRGVGVSAAGLFCTGLVAFGYGDQEPPSGHAAMDAIASTPVPADAEAFVPDAEVSITAVQKSVQILPGAETAVYSFEGKLLSGSGVTVDAIPGTSLGPIIRAESGTKLRIVIHNELPEATNLHPHGLRVPVECDGHPMQTIDPGKSTAYEFTVIDHAGPYWFHPHPMGRTAEQVALGMAGLFYVWDADEVKAVPGADTGANDVPVVIQDRLFDDGNQILYQPNMMWGYLGDRILVNGQVDATLSLEPRAYRLRILNGSNARTYKLAWSNGMPLQVVGTDGGLLPAVIEKNFVMLMPGERLDIWTDLSGLEGEQVTLQSAEFVPGGMGMMGGSTMGTSGMQSGKGMMGNGMMRGGRMRGGMMGATGAGGAMGMGGMGMMNGGMMGGSTLANGTSFTILKIDVGNTTTAQPKLGPLPAMSVLYDSSNVPDFEDPRTFTLGMQHMMTWTINGRVYEPMVVAEDETVSTDQVLAWEWINNSPIPHPMHIHNVQFQVLERTSSFAAGTDGDVAQGIIDSGWKDTVQVWPGERVKTAMRFGPFTGMYMYHCHILEHEDMTMMRELMIVDAAESSME